MQTLSESMTAAELAVAITDLEAACGPKGRADLLVSTPPPYRPDDGNRVYLAIRPTGEYNNAPDRIFYAPTWPEAFAAAHAWVLTWHKIHRNDLTRRMAVAIMVATDENGGTCKEKHLIAKGFAAAEITELHVDACRRASEMAGNAPFRVEFAPVPLAAE